MRSDLCRPSNMPCGGGVGDVPVPCRGFGGDPQGSDYEEGAAGVGAITALG